MINCEVISEQAEQYVIVLYGAGNVQFPVGQFATTRFVPGLKILESSFSHTHTLSSLYCSIAKKPIF